MEHKPGGKQQSGEQPHVKQQGGQRSNLEGPAAYAPHDAGEKITKKKKQEPDTPPDGDTQGGIGSQGGM
jgi:hypothetical protein